MAAGLICDAGKIAVNRAAYDHAVSRLGKGPDGLLYPVNGPIGVNDPFLPDFHLMAASVPVDDGLGIFRR